MAKNINVAWNNDDLWQEPQIDKKKKSVVR